MRKYVLLIMCVVLCLTFVSCKKEAAGSAPVADAVVGVWSAKIDMTDTVNQMVYHQIGAETVVFEFPVTLILSLQSDGTYHVDIDREDLDVQLGRLADVFWQTVVDQAKAQSHLSSDEAIQALRAQGKTKEALMHQLDLVSLFENGYVENGVWKQSESLLCFAKDESAINTAEEHSYSLKGSKLSITYTDVNDNGEPVTNVISFEKITTQ